MKVSKLLVSVVCASVVFAAQVAKADEYHRQTTVWNKIQTDGALYGGPLGQVSVDGSTQMRSNSRDSLMIGPNGVQRSLTGVENNNNGTIRLNSFAPSSPESSGQGSVTGQTGFQRSDMSINNRQVRQSFDENQTFSNTNVWGRSNGNIFNNQTQGGPSGIYLNGQSGSGTRFVRNSAGNWVDCYTGQILPLGVESDSYVQNIAETAAASGTPAITAGSDSSGNTESMGGDFNFNF